MRQSIPFHFLCKYGLKKPIQNASTFTLQNSDARRCPASWAITVIRSEKIKIKYVIFCLI
jgi:hypothetical protein